METEELNNTIQEATEQEVVQEQDKPEVNEEVQQEQSDYKEANIREMRLRKERAEKERDEAYRLVQQMKEQYEKPAQKSDPDDEDLNIGADDFVEGKHLGKVANKIKKLEQQLKNYQQVTTSATVETRLKQKYNDFDSVVSKENVEALVRDYPEIGDTLRSNADLYSQAVSAYTMIKQLGIYREDKYEADRARAQKNAAKPRPLASVSPQQGEGPLQRANAFANGLTDELKEQLLKEMNDARSRN